MDVRKWIAVLAVGVPASQAAAQECTTLSISEIRLDQFGPDVQEYVELSGSPGGSLNNLWYIVIGDVAGAPLGTQSGGVELAINLNGLSLDALGLFVIAKDTFTLRSADLTLLAAGLPGGELFENSDNVTHLLVSGFTGSIGADLDTNDDGVLDSTPWTSVLCSVAVIEDPSPDGISQEHFYSATTVGPDGIVSPFQVLACSDTGQWIIGTVDPSATDTPGEVNPACGKGGCDGALVINEIRVDHTGTDTDEYFELAGPAGTSLNGLTYIVIGDGTAALGSGVIENVIDLTGLSIPADGHFLCADDKFGMLLAGTPDLILSGADLFENSDNMTHVLVSSFTGAVGDDLDTNDDGVLDVTPWTMELDRIAIIEEENPPTGTEFHYGPPTVGPDGTFAPGHVYRCFGDCTWLIGQFDPIGGQDTPGTMNLSCDLVFECGNPAAGDCFTPGITPNCEDAACCTAVCAIDPTCCETEWDQACVDIAEVVCLQCGDPQTGGCFEPNGSPYCDDAKCCSAVCAVDPSCCDTEWDQACADQASLLCLGKGEAPDVIINEIRIDQTGTDNDEYFELKGMPGASLDGVRYIVIGDSVGGLSGVIEAVVNLDDQVIAADGLFLVAESTLTLGTADLTAGNINFENSDNVTHLLVFNFTGSLNQDLDTDDDGVLDQSPWQEEMDRIALVEMDSAPKASGDEYHYGPPSIGPEVTKTGSFVPGHVYRCETAGDWQIGPFDPAVGIDTPGTPNPDCENQCPNPDCPADINGDTFVNGFDLGILLGNWSIPPTVPGCDGKTPCCADLNDDTLVNGFDLGILLGNWSIPAGSPGCPPNP